MKVFCCSFEATYGRLKQVLRKSIERHCPTAEWDGRGMRPAALTPGIPQHASINTGKLWTWNEAVQTTDDDIICMDADMVCLADLAPAFDGPFDSAQDGEFDFGYTVRPGLKRYQGGAVYVRNTAAAKAFMQEWTEVNDELLDDPDRLERLIHRFGGANQAALGTLLAAGGPSALTGCRMVGYAHPERPYCCLTWTRGDLRLKAMPCEIWNSCAQTWGTFGPETRLLHMTGRLRRAVLEARVPDPAGPYADMIPMVEAWLAEAR